MKTKIDYQQFESISKSYAIVRRYILFLYFVENWKIEKIHQAKIADVYTIIKDSPLPSLLLETKIEQGEGGSFLCCYPSGTKYSLSKIQEIILVAKTQINNE